MPKGVSGQSRLSCFNKARLAPASVPHCDWIPRWWHAQLPRSGLCTCAHACKMQPSVPSFHQGENILEVPALLDFNRVLVIVKSSILSFYTIFCLVRLRQASHTASGYDQPQLLPKNSLAAHTWLNTPATSYEGSTVTMSFRGRGTGSTLLCSLLLS